VSDPSQIELRDKNSVPLLLQAEPAAYWHDGSIRWLLLDFIARDSVYQTVVHPEPQETPGSPLQVEETRDAITIITGPMKLVVPRTRLALPGQVWIDADGDGRFTDDEKVTDGGDVLLELDDDEGQLAGLFRASNTEELDVRVEARGPVRATVRLSGRFAREDSTTADQWIVRLHAFAGLAVVQGELTFLNTVDVRRVRTMALSLGVPLPCLADPSWRQAASLSAPRESRGPQKSGESSQAKLLVATEEASAEVRTGTDGQIVSSYGNSLTRVLQRNACPKRPPGFEQFAPHCVIEADGKPVSAYQKVTGWLTAVGKGLEVGVALRDMWQRYPKALSIDRGKGELRIELQPESEGPLDWFGGIDPEQIAPTGAPWQSFGDDGIALTHEWMLELGTDTEAVRSELEAYVAIPDALPEPRWLGATKALGCLAARDGDALPEVERRIDRMVEWLYRHQNEWSNWYGEVDYGGLQTHYQPAFGHWSHLTERFGWIGAETEPQSAVALHYLRSGDRRAFELMRSTTRNLMDVGHRHLGEQRGFGRRHFALAWGQPGDWAHTFMRPFALLLYATGDCRVRDVIDEVSGLVRQSDLRGYDRTASNFQRCALWLYEMTGDELYREKAEATMTSVLELANEHGIIETGGTQFHTNVYLLWAMMLYDRLIGDSRVRDAIVRLMDYQTSLFGSQDVAVGPSVIRRDHWEGLQQAFLATRDPKCLWPGLRDLTTLAYQRIYERYDPVLRFPRSSRENRLEPPGDEVRPDSFASMHSFGNYLTKLPYFLYAVKEADLTDYRSRISTSVDGTHEPWSADASPARGSFVTIGIQGPRNAAPLAPDPFDYTSVPSTRASYIPSKQIEATGHVIENLRGLPWGATVFYDGIPFALPTAQSEDSLGLVALRRGESAVIPVEQSAERIHFLGQVLGNGDMEYGRGAGRYVICYRDGGRQVVTWENLVNCEDWRHMPYNRVARPVFVWAPQAFEPLISDMRNVRTSLRHINRLAVEADGRHIESIVLETGDSDSMPMLLAVTVEGGVSDASAREPSPEVSWDGPVTEEDACIACDGAATANLPVTPGQYELEMLLDSDAPIAMTIRSGDEVLVDRWHLIGTWQGRRYPQRLRFSVNARDGQLSLGLDPDPGELCDGDENGGLYWGLGWSFDECAGKWERSPPPRWRLHELKLRTPSSERP